MFCRNCGKQLVGTPEYCMNCGARPLAAVAFCNACGSGTTPASEICVKCGTRLIGLYAAATPSAAGAMSSSKSRLVAAILAFFLGIFGVHRFYLGKTGSAGAMLILTVVGILTTPIIIGVFFWIATGIWALVDFIVILVGSARDAQGQMVVRWD